MQTDKVKPEHLGRMAYVYVRQSSPEQVRRHVESQKRQYAAQDWLEQAGWRTEQIVVVDDDQGETGTIPYNRTGFGRIATAVAPSEVGVVGSLEISRLARNSPDWHHLLYVCRWTNTLLADEREVYDMSLSTDRLLLGIRGQMSEMEFHHRSCSGQGRAPSGRVLTLTGRHHPGGRVEWQAAGARSGPRRG